MSIKETTELSVQTADDDTLWDRQIEEDLDAGRLDALLAEVDREHEAGLAQAVPYWKA